MIINNLELNNFRNYDAIKLEFHEETNILYGDNAQGKTNILEAIYICCTTKSHKGSKEKDIIKMDCEESHIRIHITKEESHHKIDMHLKKNKAKGIAIDGIPIRKSSDLLGLTNIILFSPEDLNIIKSGPAERRRFMNMELCQLDKVYLYHLTTYNKIIEQRNNLLKQISFDSDLMDTLSIWDMQLVDIGNQIIMSREVFIQRINTIIYDIHKKLTGNKEELVIKYEPNVAQDIFEQKLKKSLKRDLMMKITSVGPHRDDISFMSNGNDIRRFGSQGQQRTAALSLKLSEIEIVKNMTGDKPILLLDDVLSELDRNRQNQLLDSINGIQTIITCTGLEEFVQTSLKMNHIYKVVNGNVISEKIVDENN